MEDMKQIAILVALFAAFVIESSGQTGSKAKPKSQPKTVESMSDLASPDVCVHPEKHKIPVDGVVVRRQFADDELTLRGVVVRERDDKRYFVNIDHEYVAQKGHYVPVELDHLLSKGRRVKIWVYGCGASGMMFWARTVKAF